jgi:hypothetical protein
VKHEEIIMYWKIMALFTSRLLGATLALIGILFAYGVTPVRADVVSNSNSVSAAALDTPTLQAGASSATTANLASCSAHHANTAAWMDCTGGSEKSWVRLGYNCGIPPFDADYHTDWTSISPGEAKTISAECTVRVNNSWPNIRPY